MKNQLRRFLPHLLVILSFVALSAIFFFPAFGGHQLMQSDIKMFRGMAQEIIAFRQMYGIEPLWTNSMFSGMPTYQITTLYPNNIIRMIDGAVSLGLPRPANYFFLYLFGFYLLLIAFRVKPALAAVGAVAFALSTYFIVILEVGHNSKAHAIAYMAPALAGMVWTYRGKILLGGALTALFLALQLSANHLQITYYFGFLVIFYGVAKLIEALRNGQVPLFAKASAVLVLAGILALLCNANNLWNTYEYGKYTTRGATELTINAVGESNEANATGGLDKDYVTFYSYGFGESFSFLIPNAKGGGSGALIDENTQREDPRFYNEVAQGYQATNIFPNSYWGDQPSTSGNVYMGALVFLLFLLGAFYVNGPIKWALIATALLTLALGWGKNLMGLTDFFLDYIPGYDKFRAITIILAVTELVVPLLGFLFLKRLYDTPEIITSNYKKFFGIAGGLAALLILFLVIPDTFFDFYTGQESSQFQAGLQGERANEFLLYAETLKSARIDVFREDVFRSLIFIVLGIGLLWFFAKARITRPIFIVILATLVVADMWPVAKRFLSNEKDRGRYVKWQPENETRSIFKITPADQFILGTETGRNPRVQDAVDAAVSDFRLSVKDRKGMRVSEDEVNDIRFAALRFNTDYRVLTLGNPFNDGRVPYFHKSIGGYHGAKLKRYQELIEFHIQRDMQGLMNVMQNSPTREAIGARLQGSEILNMLNTKYIIYNEETAPIVNPAAYGSAWFVEDLILVENANEEITKLGEISTRYEAVVDRRFADQIDGFVSPDSSNADIAVETHLPNYIKYIYASDAPQATIFSEIYYDAGWKAYLDGNEVPYFRANYLLRGMIIPEGDHIIEFKFEPEGFATAATVSTAFGLILVLGVVFALYRHVRKKEEEVDY